ncbi:hypothetical protein ACLESO_15335 [Pyxidicoccus sp. 3LG]
MKGMRKVGVLVTGLVAGGLAACSPLRMGVPESLDREARPVPIHQDKDALGDGRLRVEEFFASYDTDAVERVSGAMSMATVCGARSAYRFELAHTRRANLLEVECEEQMSGKQAELAMGEGSTVGVSDSQNRVSCKLRGGGRLDFTQTRRLEGATTLAPIVQGQVEVEGVKLLVESTSAQQKGLPVPYLGFHFRRGEQPVASVQVHQPTQLWLAPDLSQQEREAVVLAAFSLMLQRTWTSSGPLDCGS